MEKARQCTVTRKNGCRCARNAKIETLCWPHFIQLKVSKAAYLRSIEPENKQTASDILAHIQTLDSDKQQKASELFDRLNTPQKKNSVVINFGIFAAAFATWRVYMRLQEETPSEILASILGWYDKYIGSPFFELCRWVNSIFVDLGLLLSIQLTPLLSDLILLYLIFGGVVIRANTDSVLVTKIRGLALQSTPQLTRPTLSAGMSQEGIKGTVMTAMLMLQPFFLLPLLILRFFLILAIQALYLPLYAAVRLLMRFWRGQYKFRWKGKCKSQSNLNFWVRFKESGTLLIKRGARMVSSGFQDIFSILAILNIFGSLRYLFGLPIYVFLTILSIAAWPLFLIRYSFLPHTYTVLDIGYEREIVRLKTRNPAAIWAEQFNRRSFEAIAYEVPASTSMNEEELQKFLEPRYYGDFRKQVIVNLIKLAVFVAGLVISLGQI